MINDPGFIIWSKWPLAYALNTTCSRLQTYRFNNAKLYKFSWNCHCDLKYKFKMQKNCININKQSHFQCTFYVKKKWWFNVPFTMVSAHFSNYSVAKDTSASFLLHRTTPDVQIFSANLDHDYPIPLHTATPYYYT